MPFSTKVHFAMIALQESIHRSSSREYHHSFTDPQQAIKRQDHQIQRCISYADQAAIHDILAHVRFAVNDFRLLTLEFLTNCCIST